MTPGKLLPNAVEQHCAVTAQDGTIFIVGGYPPSNYRKVWIYNSKTETFTSGPNMRNVHRHHACALFKSAYHNGREVLLVAGGLRQDTTEVWDYQSPGTTWTSSKWECCVFT